MRLKPDDYSGVHGKDERITVAAMGDAVVRLVELTKSMTAVSAAH
jgi:di/tripeptidase